MPAPGKYSQAADQITSALKCKPAAPRCNMMKARLCRGSDSHCSHGSRYTIPQVWCSSADNACILRYAQQLNLEPHIPRHKSVRHLSTPGPKIVHPIPRLCLTVWKSAVCCNVHHMNLSGTSQYTVKSRAMGVPAGMIGPEREEQGPWTSLHARHW